MENFEAWIKPEKSQNISERQIQKIRGLGSERQPAKVIISYQPEPV